MKRMMYALDCEEPTGLMIAGLSVFSKRVLVAKCVH